MKTAISIILCLAALLALPGCLNKRETARGLIRDSQELRDNGQIQEAREKLMEAVRIAPAYPETYLELGMLHDEYLKDSASAAPFYEEFLKLSKDEEMRAKVAAWLKEAREGISLPLTSVAEMPPEARELLEQRTAQYEELRRQLINRYEGELAKLREEVAASKQGEDRTESAELTVATLDVKPGGGEARELTVPGDEDDTLTKKKAAEEQAAVKKAEEEKLAAQKKAEDEKLAAEKKAAEEKLAAEKKAEEAKLAAEKKAEEERLAAERERLAKEKKEKAERIDAYVDKIVKAGAEAGQSTTISTAALPKEPEKVGYPELELTDEEKEGASSTNAVASAEAPSKKAGEEVAGKKEEEKPSPRIHVVQQGDNLGNISRKYYGEFKRWKDIAEANKEILPDPNKLKLGMKLVIPE